MFTSNCFSLLFFFHFGVDEAEDLSLFTAESCSSDNSLLRDANPSRSSFFKSDKDFVRSVSVSDCILTVKLEKFES